MKSIAYLLDHSCYLSHVMGLKSMIFYHQTCFNFTFSEPLSGFKIAFNMFDADGNELVDKKEFLVVGGVLYLNHS